MAAGAVRPHSNSASRPKTGSAHLAAHLQRPPAPSRLSLGQHRRRSRRHRSLLTRLLSHSSAYARAASDRKVGNRRRPVSLQTSSPSRLSAHLLLKAIWLVRCCVRDILAFPACTASHAGHRPFQFYLPSLALHYIKSPLRVYILPIVRPLSPRMAVRPIESTDDAGQHASEVRSASRPRSEARDVMTRTE